MRNSWLRVGQRSTGVSHSEIARRWTRWSSRTKLLERRRRSWKQGVGQRIKRVRHNQDNGSTIRLEVREDIRDKPVLVKQ